MTSFTGTMFQMGAAPALEEAMKFNEDRHRRILSNIANAETPHYRRQDLDSARFSEVLGRAIEERDHEHPGAFFLREDVRGRLDSRHGFRAKMEMPYPGVDGPLRHDENNVSIEREMALLAKNAGGYSTYAGLLNKAFKQIASAIAERPTQG